VPPADGDRQPSGYAYRYQQFGDSVIRFNGGSEVNGSRPTEAIPYWLGHPPRPIPPADGEVAELVRLLLVEADHDKARDHTIWLTADNMRRIAALLQQGQSAIHRLHRLQQENSRFREPERTILCDLLANGTLLPDPDGKRYGVQPVAEALAARPLLEQVARMGDRIGQHTVAEIMVISDRAAAWLRENPPGQPVAVEPRGCPMPGACACVEPAPPTEGEVAELVEWLHDCANVRMDEGYERPAFKFARAATLLQHLQPPHPVAVSERPWERDGWVNGDDECWIGYPSTTYAIADTGDYDTTACEWRLEAPPSRPEVSNCVALPFHALPIPTTPPEAP
jgi:hypothetical protein